LEDAIPLRFVHPLVRHAVHADMAEPTRALLHASAANRLREAGEAVDTVASHLLLAPPAGDPTVVAALLGAAEGAMARGAPASAVEYLRRALREPPDEAEREEISRGLGDALLRADDAEGIEVLASILDRSTDPDERAEIAAWMIVALAGRGRVEEAHDLYLGALEELGKHEGHTGVLIKGFALMLPMVGLEEIPAGAVIAADDAGFDNRTIAGRVLLEGSALLTAYGLGTIERARELAELSILDRRTAITDAEAGYPRHRTVLTLTLADRQDLVEDAAEEMTQASRRRGSINGVAYGHAIRSLCLALDGELQEAVASAELAVELAGQTDQLANLENWTSMLAMILIHRGELGRVAELLSAPPLAGDLGGGIPAANLLIRRGELHLASGRATEARDAFLAAGDRVAWLPRANPEVLPWRIGLAEAEMTLGNEEGAREIAEEGVERAVEAGGRRGIGIALRVRGKVLGDLEVLGAAVETLAATRARLQHAIALVELGAALRRANRRSDAREPLREGLELAHRCGAAPLEDRARTELEATGARPRSAVRSGVDALTPSELRAARMAADGMTNREIAQALFVTAKTVETHLRHAYQKLGIEGRGGLAEVLAPRA
jgi:DNA-binding CsgD family transcriptional regulator